VLIGLGSNLGDRLAWLRLGRHRIAALPATALTAASSVYETDPVGGPPQGRYLNACVTVETALEPLRLLDALLAIESEAGRVRSGRDEPRTLDLDVLLFAGREIAGDRLVVPHPRFASRPFALVPAREIAGAWPVPPGPSTVKGLAARVSAEGIVRHCGEEGWR
jgi:2-amino-4-hydroxy-6-hydroxymethyldihydropteridine diphosphokinase